MKLKITKAFRIKLQQQLEYIAKDKPLAAQKFKDDVITQIENQFSSIMTTSEI